MAVFDRRDAVDDQLFDGFAEHQLPEKRGGNIEPRARAEEGDGGDVGA